MILLDPRAGSKEYESRLRALGADVDMLQMDFGDVAFYGSGFNVGIELKKFDDMLQCIVTGRFAGHQLRGLVGYDAYYVFVEGLWRPNPTDGVLEVWSWDHEKKKHGWIAAGRGKQRAWMYRDFDNYLTTMDVRGGVRIKRTASEDETARAIINLYSWWQDYDGHKSHLALNRSRDTALLTKPTLRYEVASVLPGLGSVKAGMVAGHFSTVREMVNADATEWAKLPGIGKKIANDIVEGWDSDK